MDSDALLDGLLQLLLIAAVLAVAVMALLVLLVVAGVVLAVAGLALHRRWLTATGALLAVSAGSGLAYLNAYGG